MEALIDKAESREQKAESRKQNLIFLLLKELPKSSIRYPQTSFFFIVNLTSIQFL